ncbi:hypothetical protein AGABI2DRAFT_148226 [Agaricus bisporus var. bisporus H97]|uniref:hypothetical protein n=1 Tax=Agaricus bisporus var. bisporus (strain H97 / ATCC MYA-4626 / FGSC 10389) TaxID=936046 RepID=UPI00029F7BEC|nr:hypothetical protein AGABI2DRAFT_148226 [Agaricus bisporus var. bisporus H97]EKV51890.1 hypothetical protein AGABI2DRAFT_148226 [Agaricus bisporus var. bisporus H97]
MPSSSLNSPPTATPTYFPPPVTVQIVPEEDPQQSIDNTALQTDGDDNGLGDGLGEGDDEDEDEDNADDDVEGQSTSQPLRPLPPWLMNAFNERVKEASNRNADDRQMFWFQEKATYFILENTSHVLPMQLYNPRFFLWDPQALYKSLPCPNCARPLHRSQVIPRPRRCVDFHSTFYLIGYRYRCRSCCNPRTGKQSNGMGSKQFSDALRVQHVLAYDDLHLRYLEFFARRQFTLGDLLGRKYETFLPFDDRSPKGQHGFVPSSPWLCDVYDEFIENHQHEINQQTAMLPANICSIDHSHKITKHIARVDGEQVFTGLLTVTNDLGQIRTCNPVATKSHSQFESALFQMRRSLDTYSHDQPQIFYTDNISDRLFLKNSFPLLRNNVVAIDKYADLDPFEVSITDQYRSG